LTPAAFYHAADFIAGNFAVSMATSVVVAIHVVPWQHRMTVAISNTGKHHIWVGSAGCGCPHDTACNTCTVILQAWIMGSNHGGRIRLPGDLEGRS